MILVIDSETSGLWKRDLPPDHPGQPWIVTLGAKLRAPNGDLLGHFSTRIKAEGRKIETGAEAVHGISSVQAGRTGVPEVVALGMLCHFAAQAKYLVGYGIESFDRRIVVSLLMRMGKDTKMFERPSLEFVDVMFAAMQACRLPSDHEAGGYRWPSLDEAGEIILGEKPREGRHDVWDDVERCDRLFTHLVGTGHIEVIL